MVSAARAKETGRKAGAKQADRAVLTVRGEDSSRRIKFEPGRSLRELLDAADIRVRTGCRSTGACGLCRIKMEKGDINSPTKNERLHLGADQISQGVRLACQIMPEHDLEITILNPAPKSNWKIIHDRGFRRTERSLPPLQTGLRDMDYDVKSPYGVAVDLGTTNISVSIFDLSSGAWLAERRGQNPQAEFGSDVVTRLTAASESDKYARIMSRKAIEAIGEALLDISVREGIDLKRVVHATIAGNTAMIALLSGRNYRLLLQPDKWTSFIDCLPENTDLWPGLWGIYSGAKVEVIPPLAGFIGSDLLAGIVVTGLTEKIQPALLIDFGTNSEIALWDGNTVWVTSAAGGPAFESSGISCGMPAESGAVYRVRHKDKQDKPDELAFDVIGDAELRGLCGSGLVDLIACLLRNGLLTETGRLRQDNCGDGFKLVSGENKIVLTNNDIDMLQRAKAATSVGIGVLAESAGIGPSGLKRICICGEFGRFLDVANARAIGLLPEVPADIVEFCGNTALLGCEDIMLSDGAAHMLTKIKKKAKIINLSMRHDFDDMFFENLYLTPMKD